MRRVARLALCVVGVLHSFVAVAAAQDARLLRRPTVSRDAVAFAYASDLWIVGREGGRARRLTSTPTVETDPRFSPDGSQIAFTATVGGNTDVYVMPSAGGTPRRLTHHPGLDLVRGWTRDGQRVIFGSARGVLPTPRVSSYVRLWTVGLEGGLPQMLPMPRAYTGTFSPDASKIAYEEFSTEFESKEGQLQSAQWRHYRGGRTHPIRVMNLEDYTEQTLPWSNSNDSDPMWIGDRLYFVSDREFTANLFAYDTKSKQLTQLTRHDDHDIMNASAGPDAIVYEQAGFIHLLDVLSGRSHQLHIQIEADFPWIQPQMKSVAAMIGSGAVSPDGRQIALEARGDIFVQPAAGKNAVNLTQSPAAHERNPSWSPSGAQLAWLSDASGEYQLHIAAPVVGKRPRVIDLPLQGYFSTPGWSPDGRFVLLRDNHLTLWLIELASGQATRVDADTYDDPKRRIEPVWSVDSRWIAYSKNLSNHLRAIFLYSLAQRKAHQLTDSSVDAISPAFDRSGEYLYFLVSRDYGQNVEWLGMSALDRPPTRTVHAAVLSAAGLPPQTAWARAAGDASAAAKPRIDIEGMSKRIVPLDIPAADYAGLIAGPPGIVLYAEYEKDGVDRVLAPKSLSLHRYQGHGRDRATLLRGIDQHDISASGGSLLYRRASDQKWALATTLRPIDASDAEIDTTGLSMRVDPRTEWGHIFRESWRIQRDHFYQPSMHGANWQAIYDKYAPWVAHANHRSDLDYLLATVGGELSVGHSALIGPGDAPSDERVNVGMLGADYAIEGGRYRIKRIYSGDMWNPALQAPLAAPGLGIKEGDYLLEVNGRPVLPSTDIYAYFEGTAGKRTELRISASPQASNARLVTVTPVADEEPLRTHDDWVEKNRRLVEQLSGGRIGYVWLLNTGPHGYQAFNRQLYAQLDKSGVIIDVRYNQGGFIADYIVHGLARPPFGYIAMRDGASNRTPIGAIHGPKVMLINESSGSGGDALPYHFKLSKVGPLVGTRTWGGLVGAEEPPVPRVLDGGGMTAPNAGFFDLQGRWLVENEGVAPDIEIENAPKAVIAGHDPQLERAVEEALRMLKNDPVQHPPRPAPPDRVSPTPR